MDPTHKRKRIISLTPKGSELVAKSQKMLDEKFTTLLHDAQVDETLYGELTERIYKTVIQKKEV